MHIGVYIKYTMVHLFGHPIWQVSATMGAKALR
jgi:hypothetical protein